MDETLQANGVTDEGPNFDNLLLNRDTYIPAVHLYFNDDLTTA
jgi:hypothetical protein